LDDPQSPIKRFLYQQFPNTAAIRKRYAHRLSYVETIRPTGPMPYPYGLIGIALDYRLRYYLAVTEPDQLVAWQGAHLCGAILDPYLRFRLKSLYGVLDEDPRFRLSPDLARAFFTGRRMQGKRRSDCAEPPTGLRHFLPHLQPVGRRLDRSSEELLARYCIVLALFEQLFRAGRSAAERSPLFLPTPKTTLADLLAIAHEGWIDDLCSLSWAFYDHRGDLLNCREFVLNPTFDGSGDIGGADADLIVDGCLIDIKATIKPRVDSEWLYQLLGYTLLDYGDCHHITDVGIYLARQHVLLRWPLHELVSVMSNGQALSLGELRSRFEQIIRLALRSQ
jgi:hypothetical protein